MEDEPMPVDEFDTSLHHLSPAEFIITGGNFADSLLNHGYFKDNWVDFVTHPLQLKEKLAAYNEAVKAYDADGGKKNLKERDERRQDAHVSIVLMGQFCIMKAVHEKNPSLLDPIALKLKSRQVRTSSKIPITLVAPVITVKHSASGAITVSFNKVAGAGSNEVQVCTGDPNDESAWKFAGTYKNCRIELTGYEPGSKVYVRGRCHGTGEPGPFSQVVSIIVI
jgi:hypothetical protein